MTKVKEKREFLLYIIGIKHNIKIKRMLQKYIQHRKHKRIYTFKKCRI